jgi:hypothetical protein
VRRIKRQGHGWFTEAEVLAHLHERARLSMACLVFVLLGMPVADDLPASNRTVAFSLAFAIVIVFYYPIDADRPLARLARSRRPGHRNVVRQRPPDDPGHLASLCS